MEFCTWPPSLGTLDASVAPACRGQSTQMVEHNWDTHTCTHTLGLGNISINRQYRLIKYPQYDYCMHLAFTILSPRQYLSHLAIIIALIV